MLFNAQIVLMSFIFYFRVECVLKNAVNVQKDANVINFIWIVCAGDQNS